MVKKILLTAGIIIGSVLLLFAGLILFLTVTEYKPEAVQPADRQIQSGGAAEMQLTLCSWNIGYAGLGQESDFFMDGGKMVYPPSQQTVEENIAGIQNYIQENPADIWLLQEVDLDSERTDGMDQFQLLQETVSGSAAFAYNYKCPFVPIPLPPIGKMESGIATFSRFSLNDPQRISLPCPFTWPVRAANMKRCLLVSRLELEGTDRELVIINLHLEAYESGEGRIAQTKQLLELMEQEYAAGNYVIAGGDFNQTFPDALDQYPILDGEKWTPGVLEQSSLPEGWHYAYDSSSATCRLLDKPYCPQSQLYVIDGFILSANVRLEQVQTDDLDFVYSDHNPVRICVSLLP